MGKEKKEIGMEKLIELLNEYVEETDFGDNLDEYNEAEILDEETLEVNGEYHDIEYLYTKKFGFIKWLVENDKIDYEKIGTKIGMEYHKAYFPINKYWYVYDMETGSISSAEYSDYESLLMLLAIQDEPIRFLCEILK